MKTTYQLWYGTRLLGTSYTDRDALREFLPHYVDINDMPAPYQIRTAYSVPLHIQTRVPFDIEKIGDTLYLVRKENK